MDNGTPVPAHPDAGGSAHRPSLRKWWLAGLTVVFLLAAGGAGCWWWLYARFYQSTDDAYVSGNLVQLTPQISGIVTDIRTDDTRLVKEGQPVVMLDQTDAAVALDQAKAELAETVRRVRQLYQNVDELRANVQVRETDVSRANADLSRRRAVIGTHAVSDEELQHALLARDSARAALNLARHQLASAAALVDGTTLTEHPDVRAAAAKVEQASVALQRTSLPAPVAGYVARRSVQIGQQVAPGTPLMAIVPLNDMWVEANFKETHLEGIRIGQPVAVTTDLYGSDVVFHGKVLGLSAGTGSAFALLPPENATGNWIKVVQRLPVRISLDAQELNRHALRVGLSVHAKVDMHSSGPVLAKIPDPPEQPGYSTRVFDDQMIAARQLIDEIVRANAGATPPRVDASAR
jgi:membrane fusion protein (multidrug efflux system)